MPGSDGEGAGVAGIGSGRARRNVRAALVGLVLAGPSVPAFAETFPGIGLLGYPGLVDMPTGETMPDGAFSITASGFGPPLV